MLYFWLTPQPIKILFYLTLEPNTESVNSLKKEGRNDERKDRKIKKEKESRKERQKTKLSLRHSDTHFSHIPQSQDERPDLHGWMWVFHTCIRPLWMLCILGKKGIIPPCFLFIIFLKPFLSDLLNKGTLFTGYFIKAWRALSSPSP